MEGVIAFLAVLAVIMIIAGIKNKSKKNKIKNTDTASKTVDYRETKPVSRSTTDIFHASKNDENEENHKITKILMYNDSMKEKVWICENCESENRVSFEKCSVCGHHR